MKKQLIIAFCFCAAITFPIMAQQALFGGPDMVSPEVHEDLTVSFTARSTDIHEVKLTSDWMPVEGWTGHSSGIRGSILNPRPNRLL